MIMEIEKLMFWKKKIKKQFFLQQCIPALELEAEESDKKSERLKSMRVKLVNIEADLNEIQMELESQPLEDVDSVLSKCKSGEVLAGIIRNDELLGKSQEILEKILEKVNNV
jgi:hypothetical protein